MGTSVWIHFASESKSPSSVEAAQIKPETDRQQWPQTGWMILRGGWVTIVDLKKQKKQSFMWSISFGGVCLKGSSCLKTTQPDELKLTMRWDELRGAPMEISPRKTNHLHLTPLTPDRPPAHPSLSRTQTLSQSTYSQILLHLIQRSCHLCKGGFMLSDYCNPKPISGFSHSLQFIWHLFLVSLELVWTLKPESFNKASVTVTIRSN